MKWALMTANYVAKEMGYGTEIGLHDWGKCHDRTVEVFHGPAFQDKFEELVVTARQSGFDALELWVAHLDPVLATPDMIRTVKDILHAHDMEIVSYTAGFGRPGVTQEEAIRVFEVAQALGAHVLAQGFHPANGPVVQPIAKEYGIYVGLENHPEKTPGEVIDKVTAFSPWIGSALDTGWFATQGYDAVEAVYELKDVLVHVHLKDVVAQGSHDSCTLGDGIVDIQAVLRALKEIDYKGDITIEHEPFDHDPTVDTRESLVRAKAWWAE